MQNEPKFFTIAQAAEFLKVSPDTLRRWETKGLVVPQRTKGGNRRYTLLDLKIAKLKRKVKQKYINSRRDLKIAMFTSLVWIFALLAFHFLTPVFLKPTNPEQPLSLDQLKKQTSLKIAADVVLVKLDQAPASDKTNPPTTGSNILIQPSSSLPALQYTENLDKYYSLENIPQAPIPSLIKRT